MLYKYKTKYRNNQSLFVQAKAPRKGNGKNILFTTQMLETNLVYIYIVKMVQNIYEQNSKNITGVCKTKYKQMEKFIIILKTM